MMFELALLTRSLVMIDDATGQLSAKEDKMTLLL